MTMTSTIDTRSGSTHRREAEEAWLREADARPGSRTDVDSRRLTMIRIRMKPMMRIRMVTMVGMGIEA